MSGGGGQRILHLSLSEIGGGTGQPDPGQVPETKVRIVGRQAQHQSAFGDLPSRPG